MSAKSEPWYIHAALYVIIIVLVYILIRVAIIEPSTVLETENYFKEESRLRMTNLREAEILWQKKYGKFTDNLDSLIYFIKNDASVANVISGFDTLTKKPTNPFRNLSSGEFSADSLFYSPKSGQKFIVKIDTTVDVDTVINRRGVIVKIDSTIVMGQRYVIENPDSKDKIGDLYSDALKNTASWE